MTNRANTADKPRRNSGNQFSLATTETWKIIALRKKETEGVVRGGDSSYQPRLACKRTSSRNWSSLVVGGGKVWEPCVILIGLMPTSYNTTQPFPLFSILLHASVFFSHPCWLRPLGATTVTSLARRFKRENGIIWKIFYVLAKLSSELFVKTISCRACKSFVWHIRAQVEYLFLSRGCILLSSDLSNFFSWRERRVFLVRSCSCVNSWEIENIILRDLFRASHERERIKNFSKDCDGRVKFVISQVTVS